MQGLRNIGNSCYMNSVLQLLYKQDCFMIDVDLKFTNSEENSFLVTYYFMEIYKDLKAGTFRTEYLQELLQAIRNRFPHFHHNQQQDAQEFLCILLDLLHEELKKPNSVPPIIEFKNKADYQLELTKMQSHIQFENSPIATHFGNLLLIEQKCSICNCCTYNIEQHFMFTLDLKEGELINVLQNYFNTEQITKSCDNCKTQQKCQKRIQLIHVANNLLLCMNRYKKQGILSQYFYGGTQIVKNTVRINHTESIKLLRQFTISGIIEHIGEKDKGHYVYHHRFMNNKWTYFNDSKCGVIPPQYLQSLLQENGTSYILIYN